MKKIIITVAAGLTASLLTGCASIVNGTHQSVSVQTTPVQGAVCSLTNNKGTWFVNGTPGSVMIHQSYGDLFVQCRKPGYETARMRVKSNTKGMVFGNAVFGGVVGAGVDVADGAAYHYPNNIVVPMERISRWRGR